MELLPTVSDENPLSITTSINQETKEFIAENLYSDNTMDGYKSDVKVFKQWVTKQGINQAPTVQNIVDFFQFQAQKLNKKISTLSRYKVALVKAFPIIKNNEAFSLFFRSLKNNKATLTKHSKPILADEIVKKIKEIDSDKYRFLLTIQYKGAFRISEVLNLRVKDIAIENCGLKVHLVRTKTSKEGAIVGIQNNGLDVVSMFKKHVKANKLNSDDTLFNKLSRQTVNQWIKRNLGKAYSSHSLRSGHITTSIKQGKDLATIKKTSRHKSTTTLIDNYYTPANVFDNTTDVI